MLSQVSRALMATNSCRSIRAESGVVFAFIDVSLLDIPKRRRCWRVTGGSFLLFLTYFRFCILFLEYPLTTSSLVLPGVCNTRILYGEYSRPTCSVHMFQLPCSAEKVSRLLMLLYCHPASENIPLNTFSAKLLAPKNPQWSRDFR